MACPLDHLLLLAVSGSSLRGLDNGFHPVEGFSQLASRTDTGEEVIQQETPGTAVVGIIS